MKKRIAKKLPRPAVKGVAMKGNEMLNVAIVEELAFIKVEGTAHKWLLVRTGYPKASLLPANGMKEYYNLMEMITNSANKVFELDERFNHINS